MADPRTGLGLPAAAGMRLHRRLVLLAVLLVIVVAAGTLGFVVLEGWSWFDGFYMTITTLTTIGGEVQPLDRPGRIFNIVLILVGFTTLFALLGTLTQALIELELGAYFGQRRMEREISKLRNHFVVCGLGRVGSSVVRELRAEGATFVVIERDRERAQWAVGEELLLVEGDATREEVLRRAGIERARGLVAALAGDAENLYIVLAARELNPGLKIVARAAEEEAQKTMRRAGADLIISPYSYAGQRLAQALLRAEQPEQSGSQKDEKA